MSRSVSSSDRRLVKPRFRQRLTVIAATKSQNDVNRVTIRKDRLQYFLRKEAHPAVLKGQEVVDVLRAPGMVPFSQLTARLPFGEYLVEKRVISDDELATALNLQKQSSDRLGKLLIDIGAVSEGDMVRHLGDHLGIRTISSENFPQVPVLENTFSVKFMRECKFVPIRVVDEKSLVIAMADPLDHTVSDSVRLYTEYQNIEVVLAAESEILDLIEKFYGNQASSLGASGGGDRGR